MNLFIGHCKRCKGTARFDAPEIERRTSHLGYGRTETHVYRRLPNGVRVEGYDRFFERCWCGAFVEFKKLRGTVSPKECNDKCMSAHGPSCECSCAGQNHGASFSC